MKFRDEGVIIDIKKYGENSLIVKVFSQNHGIYRGFVRFGKSKKTNAIFQVGNLVSFEFMARLEDSLGSFVNLDLVEGFCGKIIFDKLKLDCTKSLFSMLNELFLEREKQEDLFLQIVNFLQKISIGEIANEEIITSYIKLELSILQHLGYGLDLTSCAATGATTDLAFVSPKSGCAVSLMAGKIYEKKLLKLPEFLTRNLQNNKPQELLEGLNLSGYFLQKFLSEENRNHNFSNRENILNNLKSAIQN